MKKLLPLLALAFLLAASPGRATQGACKNWIGKWHIYEYNAATDNVSDHKYDNITISSIVYDNATGHSTIGSFNYCCVATGLRQSDSSPVSIVRQTVAQDDPPTIYIPENTYRYYLTADIVDLGPFDPFAQICAVNFYSTTFTTADLPFNCSGGASSPDQGQ